MSIKEIDFSKIRHSVIHDLSSGDVTFTLSYQEVKDLYFACLVNQSRSASFAKTANLLSSFFSKS